MLHAQSTMTENTFTVNEVQILNPLLSQEQPTSHDESMKRVKPRKPHAMLSLRVAPCKQQATPQHVMYDDEMCVVWPLFTRLLV